ncbi:mechanosensitive ion channel family protein [Reyranella sp.]|uniref:mechanosensitive ion channel family protein n=1 Tax=Reyranella sp. TaxID=1929291 RepID=UPI003783D135
MMRSRYRFGALAGGWAAFWATVAVADSAYNTEAGTTGSFLKLLTERLEFTLREIPALGAHLTGLPGQISDRVALLLLGIVAAGLLAEFLVRLLLSRARLRGFDRLVGQSPLRAFGRALLLDVLALVALGVAGRVVVAQIGDPQSVGNKLGQQVFAAMLYWRSFNLVFRAWLRPGTPEGRIAPIDDAAARGLLIALNWVIVLPLLGSHIARALEVTGAAREVISAAVILYAPLIAACLLWVVWHWHKEMAAWLSAMVSPNRIGRRLKLDTAVRWWVFGLLFYAMMGLAAVYAALTEANMAARGLTIIESALIALLLFETLMHRIRRHIVSELPMAGDVVADCLRLVARLYVVILVVDAMMVRVLGAMTAAEWATHDRGAKIAAVTAVAIYALWRFIRYRMDSYIAANPLPSADATGDAEEDVKVAASRLRTLMPLLRAITGATILVVGGLLVLAELGVNITPLIAGASVFGLAVSFGSQSLVRDIVSGVFFLAEDSFRIGEYVDCSRVKGTVEGFSVRSLKLRHQNGQLHIVPFGQVGHITNFSRDWTVVKFNLAFAPGTDIELLRKTVKKLGLEMAEDPAFKPIIMQPLKMQGVVDIKDSQVIVRFKFMARPKNPSIIQRTAIRRMYDTLPGLGIRFATPTMTAYPTPMMPGGVPATVASPPAAAPAPSPTPANSPTAPEAKVAAE